MRQQSSDKFKFVLSFQHYEEEKKSWEIKTEKKIMLWKEIFNCEFYVWE